MEKQVSEGEKSFRAMIRVLVILLLVVAIGTVIRFFLNQSSEAKLLELEERVSEMKSSIHIDSIRQYQVQKIITIIELYNHKMTRQQKYEIAQVIVTGAEQFPNISVDLICAIITHETGGTWDPRYISTSGSMGLMQIMPITGMLISEFERINWVSAEQALLDPEYNIRIGTRYLSILIDQYDLDGGLAGFKEGVRNAAKYKNQIWSGTRNREIQNYIDAIHKLIAEFQQIPLGD